MEAKQSLPMYPNKFVINNEKQDHRGKLFWSRSFASQNRTYGAPSALATHRKKFSPKTLSKKFTFD